MNGVARDGQHLNAALGVQIVQTHFTQNGNAQGSEKGRK